MVSSQDAPEQCRRAEERLRVLSEATHAFADATLDYNRLLDLVAQKLGALVGDLCVIRATSEDGQWLESAGAAFHRNPELLAATREIMARDRQKLGEGISGHVAATGKAFLTPHISPAEFAASSAPRYRPFLERLAVTSAITLPLICRGKVVGVANMMRSGTRPYDDEDLRLVQSVADHAALAIGNARLIAAERAAREAAEEATKQRTTAESRFARLSGSGILGILVNDLEGTVFEVNDALLALLGYSREELLSGGIAWPSLTSPEWHDVDANARVQLLATGVGGLREKEYLRKDGARVPVLVGSAMLEDESGRCISFVLDLTERKNAEQAVERLRTERAAEARFRALLETAPDAMVIVGASGAITFANRQVEALFGYAPGELLGQQIEKLIPERSRSAHPAHRDDFFRAPRARAMGAGLDLLGRRRDGTEFPVEISLSPLETEDGLLVSSAIRDITERKKAEQQNARLAAIVEASDDAIIGKTLDGVITSWNDGARRVFGYTAEEAVGRSIGILIPPGREDEEEAILRALALGEVKRFDAVRRRKDGRDVDVSVTTSPVRDAKGRVVGVSKVARDITERKRAEDALACAKDAAELASRELEAFSYSVAHDLRAPLRGMNGFAQVLLDDYGAKFDAEGQDWLREILANARRMGDLIDALLSLSRVTRTALKRESVDLSALVRATCAKLATNEPGRAVEAVIEDHLRAEVDPTLARALVENLVGNAWKFTAHTPAARIEFGATTKDGAPAFFVRDNGAGFDPEFAGKLFAPFQRLHTTAEFPGTGIGLANVQRIVRRHGGRIWAEGKVNHGATFLFSLPAERLGTTR